MAKKEFNVALSFGDSCGDTPSVFVVDFEKLPEDWKATVQWQLDYAIARTRPTVFRLWLDLDSRMNDALRAFLTAVAFHCGEDAELRWKKAELIVKFKQDGVLVNMCCRYEDAKSKV